VLKSVIAVNSPPPPTDFSRVRRVAVNRFTTLSGDAPTGVNDIDVTDCCYYAGWQDYTSRRVLWFYYSLCIACLQSPAGSELSLAGVWHVTEECTHGYGS